MKTFFKNIKKYYNYAIYSGKAELKAEVANSYLSWLWWFLEPICFMLIYMFIVQVVFKRSEPSFPVFVFIGLTAWNFFNGMIFSSVKLFANNKSILSKVYIPKYILLFSKSYKYVFKAMISFILILILMCIFRIKFTFYILFFIPVFIVLYILTFGISSIVMHFGTYVEDLQNVINIILKLVFYLSGIFYNINKDITGPLKTVLLKINPIASMINELRKILILGEGPSFKALFFWLLMGSAFVLIGAKLIDKYEKGYVKVI